MFIPEFLVLLFELFIFFICVIMFFPIKKYKKIKTKEDQLFLEKIFISFLFFSIDIIIGILNLINIISSNMILCIIVLFIFNIYIMAIVFYNFFLCLELYFTYSNPIHLFNRLFKLNKYNNIPEFFILAISVLTIICDSIFYSTFKEIYENEQNITRFMMPNFYKSIVIILFSLISGLICLKEKSQIKKFCFKKQEKLINVLNKRLFNNILYLIFGVLYAVPWVFFKSNIDYQKTFNIIISFLFLPIIIIDFIIHIILLAH